MSASNPFDGRPLALPTDDSPIPSPAPRPSASRQWSRSSLSISQRPKSFRARFIRKARALHRHADHHYRQLSLIQRSLLIAAGVVTLVLGVLFLIFNEKIFGMLEPMAEKWRDLPGGWIILWIATFVVSFPPLIGYSSCVTAAGFVWGFPLG